MRATPEQEDSTSDTLHNTTHTYISSAFIPAVSSSVNVAARRSESVAAPDVVNSAHEHTWIKAVQSPRKSAHHNLEQPVQKAALSPRNARPLQES